MTSTQKKPALPAHETEAGRTLSHLVYRPWDGQLVAAAVRFGLAEKLADGPRSAGSFAAEIGGNPRTVEQFLRACGVLALVERDERGEYALTELGASLRADTGLLANMALMQMGEGMWNRMARLHETVLTGRPIRDDRGEELYDYYTRYPEERGWHAAAMADLTTDAGQAMAEQYDFGPYHEIVDIGGSMGLLLSKVLPAAPHVHGTVVDRPPIVENAREVARTYGLGDRLSFFGGDFFASDLPKGDLYLLKTVLCDWGDENAARILANAFRCTPPGGKLAVIDWVRPDDPAPHELDIMSISLEVVTGGRVRTEAEFVALIESVGYRFDSTKTVASRARSRPWYVREATRP
jgi:SAM-dependent methyltransferase